MRLIALLGLGVSGVLLLLVRVDRVSKGLATPTERAILALGLCLALASVAVFSAAVVISALRKRQEK
jgi:hypothetical protein